MLAIALSAPNWIEKLVSSSYSLWVGITYHFRSGSASIARVRLNFAASDSERGMHQTTMKKANQRNSTRWAPLALVQLANKHTKYMLMTRSKIGA